MGNTARTESVEKLVGKITLFNLVFSLFPGQNTPAFDNVVQMFKVMLVEGRAVIRNQCCCRQGL
jgi:hypothetical protein